MVDHFAALGTAGGAIVFFKCNIVYDITCDIQFWPARGSGQPSSAAGAGRVRQLQVELEGLTDHAP
jgi:hypothetical protein